MCEINSHTLWIIFLHWGPCAISVINIIYDMIYSSLLSLPKCYWIWGRGFSISFPVSSHDMLYSASTVRQRAAIIDGATTRLCIPAKNKAMRVTQLIVKNGWFHKDEKKETFWVSGSISQFQAPVAVHTDTTIRIMRQRPVAGCKQDTYSVSLLSKAFRSAEKEKKCISKTCESNIIYITIKRIEHCSGSLMRALSVPE